MATPTTNVKKMKMVSSNSNYIPDHLSFSILSKLPVKSLKRFSCVHKSWSRLTQNPNFINIFRNNLISNSHPLYGGDGDVSLVLNQFVGTYDWNIYLISGKKFEKKVKLDLPLPFHLPQVGVTPIRVVDSAINGILCIYDCDGVHTTTVLWNPATEEKIVIPPGHAEFQSEFMTQIFPHGFGYDRVGDDYKIIQHVNYYTIDDENHLLHLEDVMPDPFWEIFSLRSNSWRKIDFDMPTIYSIFNSAVYFNGMCHWLGESDTLLVSFKLCNEVYFVTPLPLEDTQYDDDFVVSLTVLNESVAIITNWKNTTSFQISILGEFGVEESWIRLFDVELLSTIERLIGAGEKGNIFFRRDDGELVCFDLTTGLIEEIGIKGERCWCQIAIYKKNPHLIGDKQAISFPANA
ncbi:F-box protein [Trifolium pratense]|uniref:F-box protein n=1 Tax=Trifolium pratense TaxID=57577 RepID=A0A2K3KZM2_TRIPR|nr:F-box protein [Trifolium pratense]